MIDHNLLKRVIRKNASLLSFDAAFSFDAALNDQAFISDKEIKSDDVRLANFDGFGFSWDYQSRDKKILILEAARRSHGSLFDASDLLNRIEWEQFTMAQQVVIKNTSLELLHVAMSIFSNECAAEDFIKGFVIAAQDKEFELNKKVVEAVRRAA